MRRATERAREEGRRVVESQRGTAPRRPNALRRAAPYVSGVLLLLVRIPAAAIATLLDLALAAGRWVRARTGPAIASLAVLTERLATPVRTVAFVAIAAALALAVSQFADYRGVAVSAPEYEGEIGAVAPAPFTDLETAGSAHFYAGIPLAVAAIVLIVLTARGRWRLGRAVALVGVAGIALALLVDAPQGLDAGRSGVAYVGTDARLIEGFWAQVAASAALVVCGPLLGAYSRRAHADDRAGARERSRRRAQRRAEARTAGAHLEAGA